MSSTGSGRETRTRIPRRITRNTIRKIKVSRKMRRIEQKHKDSNQTQQQGNNNDRNRQLDKTTNMIRRKRNNNTKDTQDNNESNTMRTVEGVGGGARG
jgi:hypothetical protein